MELAVFDFIGTLFLNALKMLIVPLGATVNMDGTALYECVAAMFIAQAYGIELGFVRQFTIVVMALATSIGVAAIPSVRPGGYRHYSGQHRAASRSYRPDSGRGQIA